MRLAARALRLGPPGRYALQAAIAVEHVTAARPSGSHGLYDRLAALADDPIVELNRAVAIALAGDLEGGLAHIDALRSTSTLPLLPRRPRRRAAPPGRARASGAGV